jgi:hypothetical protein
MSVNAEGERFSWAVLQRDTFATVRGSSLNRVRIRINRERREKEVNGERQVAGKMR